MTINLKKKIKIIEKERVEKCLAGNEYKMNEFRKFNVNCGEHS